MALKTLEQLFRHRNVLGVISRLKAPATPMASFYGCGPGSSREYIETREFSMEVYNHTRLMPKARPPKTGPAKIRDIPVGRFNGHMIRLHEEMDVFDEDIKKYKPLGGKIGQLDRSGQAWVGRKVAKMVQRWGNGIEFMFSRMLVSDGFGIKKDDDNYNFIEKNGSGQTFPVDYQIPAENKGNVGGIFTDLWTTSSTDVVGQFLALNAAAMRTSGYSPTIVWINSSTLAQLYENTVIRSYQGTYVRIFDIQTGRMLETIGGPRRESGYIVKFTALPQITFIVNDEVQNIDQEVDSQTVGNSTKIIPDNKAIITPAPAKGEWYDFVETDEPVRELPHHPESVDRRGFYSWQCPFEKPPGRNLTTLDNCLPVLYIPSAVYIVTVG